MKQYTTFMTSCVNIGWVAVWGKGKKAAVVELNCSEGKFV